MSMSCTPRVILSESVRSGQTGTRSHPLTKPRRSVFKTASDMAWLTPVMEMEHVYTMLIEQKWPLSWYDSHSYCHPRSRLLRCPRQSGLLMCVVLLWGFWWPKKFQPGIQVGRLHNYRLVHENNQRLPESRDRATENNRQNKSTW